jgi:hypothetical protein
MTLVRFPPRRASAIFVCEEHDGGWLVLARGHGWLHGSRLDALDDAHCSRNLGLPVRELVA